MADKNLRVVVTADTKDLDKKLKSAQKTVANFGKDATKGTEALKGFGSGLLKGAGGLSGLTLGAAAAGAAIAAMAVKIGQAAFAASGQFDDLRDNMSTMVSDAEGAFSRYSRAAMSMAADVANVVKAGATIEERLNKPVNADPVKAENVYGKIAKLSEDSGVATEQLAAGFTTAYFEWEKFIGSYEDGMNTIYTTAKKGNMPILTAVDQFIASADAMQRFGFSMGEVGGFIGRAAERGLDFSAFVTLIDKNVSKFSGSSEDARKELETIIKTIQGLEAAGDIDSIYKYLGDQGYGLQDKQILSMRRMATGGVFNGAAYEGDALYDMPLPDVDDWRDQFKIWRNRFQVQAAPIVDSIMDTVVGFLAADVSEHLSNASKFITGALGEPTDEAVNSLRRLQEAIGGIDSTTTGKELQQLAPDIVKAWKETAAPDQLENFLTSPDWFNAWQMVEDLIDKLTGEDGILQQDSLNLKDFYKGRTSGMGSMPVLERSAGTFDVSVQTQPTFDMASWTTDWQEQYGQFMRNIDEEPIYIKPQIELEPSTDFMDKLMPDTSKPFTQISTDAYQAQLKLEDNADIVAAKWKFSLAQVARSADYQFGYMRYVSGDVAASMGTDATKEVRQAWQLMGDDIVTVLGVFGIKADETWAQVDAGLSKLLKGYKEFCTEFGINSDTLWGNILTGAKRVGDELFTKLGLDITTEQIGESLDFIVGLFKDWASNIEVYWDLFVKAAKMSTDEVAKALQGFEDGAMAQMKKVIGNVIMDISEMWATGTWDWKKLFKDTFKQLLSALVDWGVKTILTLAATAEGWATIQGIMAGIMGDWRKLAAAVAGAAIVAAGIWGWSEAIKAVNNTDTEEQEPTLPLKPTYPEPLAPSVSSISPQSGYAAGNTVIIQNPTFIGQIDDRAAQAFGEGFTRSLAIRGAMPLPVA